jgi:hypothetical protein
MAALRAQAINDDRHVLEEKYGHGRPLLDLKRSRMIATTRSAATNGRLVISCDQA